MAHQKLLRVLFIAVILALGFFVPAFALDFIPGEWRVTNWIESSDGRQGMRESSTVCLTETDFLPFRCDESDCEKVDFQVLGNQVSFVYKMKNPENPLSIKGIFNYSSNKFDGVMLYNDSNNPSGSVKVMMKGELVGECND